MNAKISSPYQQELAHLLALFPTTKAGITRAIRVSRNKRETGQVYLLFEEVVPPIPGEEFLPPQPHHRWAPAMVTAAKWGLVKKTGSKQGGKFIWKVTSKVNDFLRLISLLEEGDPDATSEVQEESITLSQMAEELLDLVGAVCDRFPNYARVDPHVLAMAEKSERGLPVDW